ncbi:MAG: hypothetical protein JOZ90_08955 [Alphaproteobacteria bacterium]|nr:hypothetical protein [Alphaproteobacteria bacterium]MBV9371143.1 hypothetical protein [Alphaproteobacteria bacterium]MBV9901212.1 hypothetical protein [Alphaproteobacteria bacterium]
MDGRTLPEDADPDANRTPGDMGKGSFEQSTHGEAPPPTEPPDPKRAPPQPAIQPPPD